MTWITLVESKKPERLGKHYTLSGDGTLEKHAVANITLGTATALEGATPKKFAGLLKVASEQPNTFFFSGRLVRALDKEPYIHVAEKKLKQLLELPKDELGGVHKHNGKLYGARLKRGIEPGPWVLIDADNPLGIPDAWAAMSIKERLELLEPVLPGVATCLRIEYRASSARVVRDGDVPGGATHAWVQISNPDKLDVLRHHLNVQTQLQGLSFELPRHARYTGEVIGALHRTVIDLAVFVVGHPAFCAEPTVEAEGFHVVDANVQIVNPDGGVLDISDIALPSGDDLVALQKQTGTSLHFGSSESGIVAIDRSSLSMETPIELAGEVVPFHGVIDRIEPGDKVRCQAPFRDSTSWAAFISKNAEGEPYIHDVGLSTTYWLDINKRTEWLMAQTRAPDAQKNGSLVGAVAPENPKAAATSDWPEPTSLVASLPEAPKFGVDMLPDAFKDFVLDTAERMGVPPDYIAVPMMLSSAAALGSGWAICPKAKDKGWKETAVLWGGLLAPPGAKKSPCLQLAATPLQQIERDLHENYKLEKAAYEQAKAEHKKGGSTVFLEREPVLGRATVQDATYQKLAEICANSPHGVMAIWDEIASMIAAWKQKTQEAARGFFLSSWSGDQPYTVDRKESGTTRIDPLFITISGGVQPSVLGSLVREARENGSANDGLLQRFQLFVYPDQAHAPAEVDREADEMAQRIAFEAVKNLRSLKPHAVGAEKEQASGRGILHFDPKAQLLFDALRKKIEQRARAGTGCTLLASHFAKMPGAIAKLAMIIHLLDEETGLVSLSTVVKACKWSHYLRGHAERIYALSHYSDVNAAKTLLEKLKKSKVQEPFRARDIQRRGWADLTGANVLDRALAELVDTNWLRSSRVAEPGGGRPTHEYRINPKVYDT